MGAFIINQAVDDVSKEEPPKKKNPAAVELGRLGGKKGGTARSAVLSAQRRVEIARLAANARWKKDTEDDENK